MRELFRNIAGLYDKGKDCVLVTVTANSGSTPRGAGAKMLVAKEGRIYGTIGGGKVEYAGVQTAMKVLRDKKSELSYYQLRRNEIEDLGMICGGDVYIFFSYLSHNNPKVKSLCLAMENVYNTRKHSFFVMDISGTGEIDIVEDKTYANTSDYYTEPIALPERVLIFGGGHVSQALVPALASVDFCAVVLEDREEFCRPELFPLAEQILKISNEHVMNYIDIKSDDYVVIMTRGHKDDELIQAQILRSDAAYIGVIGSRSKREGVFNNLRKKGFTDKDLERINTPIGVNIGAETPAEIAVSIAAELIAYRRLS